MHRREPPPIATWMLDHLTSGEPDEALAGDLLEQFRAGRTEGWYWGQALAACVVSWARSLNAASPAIGFSIVWCLMAPAWYAFEQRTGNAISAGPVFNKMWQALGPLWLPVVIGGWIVLHAGFLWAGLLIYQSAHAMLGKPISHSKLRRAFWLSTLILPIAQFAAFVLENLYRFNLPNLVHASLAAPSVRQIADLGFLANLVRIPYFVALVSALWGTIPRPVRQHGKLLSELLPSGAQDLSETIALTASLEPYAIMRFLTFMVGAGLLNAMIAGFVLCQFTDPVALHRGPLIAHACFFVLVSALAGVIGAYAYWQNPWSPFRDSSPLPFTLFALVCAAGWVWVPAMMLFSAAMSTGTAFIAMIGAFFLAVGLRSSTYFVLPTDASGSPMVSLGAPDLFEETLYRPPFDLTGYAIAVGIFLAGAALAFRAIFTASSLLAISAALFAWKRTIPRANAFDSRNELKKAAWRVVMVLVPAIVVTVWALFDNTIYRLTAMRASAATTISKNDGGQAKTKGNRKGHVIAYGPGGYESLILWPYPEKKQSKPVIVMPESLLAPGTRRPLIIQFNGPYLYVQPPNQTPGADAHKAHGSPVDVDIETNNFIPVVMTARQNLSAPIRVTRCHEIEVEIENRDNLPGTISLALLLTDADSKNEQTLYLGQQPIVSAEPDHFVFKTEPLTETLRFAVPANPHLRQFTQMTVLVLPDIQHRFIAPRIAIQQFKVYPR